MPRFPQAETKATWMCQ